MRKIYYVRFRYSHHSPHSGYSRITEYAEKMLNSQVIPVSKPLSKRVIRERVLWKLANGTPGYTRAAMAAELQVAWHILTRSGCLYHFLYGETNYHYAGQFNNIRDNRIIATFHLPPEKVRQAIQIDWHLKQLSALICVGHNQVDYFSKIVDPQRVHFIPLGVDVAYYRPPSSFTNRDSDLCVIVGENYRDFPTLRGVIELVAYLRPSTRFVAVMPPRGIPYLGKHPNLEIRSGIPEAELLALYQTAAVKIMPVYDATANNAVLESMACGLPMVISDVGSVRDYVTPESGVLVPPFDARTMAQKVLELLDNPTMRAEIGAAARERAQRFSWPKVVEQHRQVYENIP